MGQEVRRDTYWGREGRQRLHRMALSRGETPDKVARDALILYELSEASFSDTVQKAVLNLFRALIPDEQYDPADDPRQEEAVHILGELLNSPAAAQGIASAFMQVIANNILHLPSLEQNLDDAEG